MPTTNEAMTKTELFEKFKTIGIALTISAEISAEKTTNPFELVMLEIETKAKFITFAVFMITVLGIDPDRTVEFVNSLIDIVNEASNLEVEYLNNVPC